MTRSRRKARQRRIMVTSLLGMAVLVAGGWWIFKGRRATPALVSAATASKAQAAPNRNESLIIDVPEEPFVWAPERSPATDALGGPHKTGEDARPTDGSPASNSPKDGPVVVIEQQHDNPAAAPLADQNQSPPAKGTNPQPTGAGAAETHGENSAIDAARKLRAEGKVIEARHRLNALLSQKLSKPEQTEVRKLLSDVADETVFSKKRLTDDPLCDLYTVASGDVLVRIGREAKVPAEILMRVNGIKNAGALRAGEKIKVLKGPFNAKIYKSEFRLDLYLQDLYVRSYPVGLGAEGGTPEGVWHVKERLENPTYYPSPSATDKRIIAADDPQNPLGEYWIGLEGVEGDAKDRFGYGIHGTIDPDSIGKAVSLGCIRMHNDDVAFVFSVLQPGQSTVTVLP